ncbi:hypothetical protein M8542_32105 [Amycolatopsis sp. OK19-0408]|uniref:Uncharacterized protein n=1 Tax=Amycolatopsis iheyensis TaxID=2945988 RepID=A0A9X2SNV0_9PSEU|nr:hypothetical protein [Amycolatopsis iheyensis]MCR6487481.1 hypothetical protein [Amycolatopsis iheyensis]
MVHRGVLEPAFGAYLRAPSGVRHGTGLYVLTLAHDGIRAMTRFENSVLPAFGLPRSLPEVSRRRT